MRHSTATSQHNTHLNAAARSAVALMMFILKIVSLCRSALLICRPRQCALVDIAFALQCIGMESASGGSASLTSAAERHGLRSCGTSATNIVHNRLYGRLHSCAVVLMHHRNSKYEFVK